MTDMNIMAAMGISGFGKQQKKKKPTVDANSFARDKRVSASMSFVRLYDCNLLAICAG